VGSCPDPDTDKYRQSDNSSMLIFSAQPPPKSIGSPDSCVKFILFNAVPLSGVGDDGGESIGKAFAASSGSTDKRNFWL